MEQTRPATPVRRGRVPRQRTAPGVVPPTAVPPGRRLRLALVLAAGVTVLLCLGGAGVAFVLYANVTAPDRGTPESAVLNFLDAHLLQRDDALAGQYVCARPSLDAIDDYRSAIVEWERRRNAPAVMSIGQITTDLTTEDAATSVVTIERRMGSGGIINRSIDRWRFGTVDEDGWRVCAAERLD
ncbi:hypothetical protein O7632_30870 [Solwaraspora sp. WMMD406]|uniref:hypothetical protein n=1 Tax=Solwaraspora sp. WMMD406 TaxID=3016095 RepID=UPI0024160C56|nr:hypothetical protein [Solwaraspora sp. WMMD406]MDG4768465.1 hypothetical protein [Solwaraspora sp. WMMD406]